jgi:enamine deaminase RidA (YjgF/YER057c/UK114 family)
MIRYHYCATKCVAIQRSKFRSQVSARFSSPNSNCALTSAPELKKMEAKSPEQRIEELGLQLPQASKGIAVYKPVVVVGNIAYTSGQLPLDPVTNQPRKGKLGDGVSVEEGHEAARLCVRSLLSSLNSICRDLNLAHVLPKSTDPGWVA